MLKALKQRRDNDEQGFTLIELMVVVLIIAILLAIAIPTFLGAQNRAKDRAVQSDLRNSLTAAKTLATDQEGFFRSAVGQELLAVDMDGAETSLDHIDTVAAATTDLIGVKADDTATLEGSYILLVKRSKASGDVFWGVKATKDGDVTYCKATTVANITAAACDDDSFSAATDLG